MISSIAPVYFKDELMGVVGLDVNLENLLKQYDFKNSMKAFFILESNGTVILASQDLVCLLSLLKLNSNGYFETVKENTYKPENYNLKSSAFAEIRNLHETIRNGGKDFTSFGTGTAAVISPIGEMTRRSTHIDLSCNAEAFKLAHLLYKQMTNIQYGSAPDIHGWLVKI